jgi:hypothetical protein
MSVAEGHALIRDSDRLLERSTRAKAAVARLQATDPSSAPARRDVA